MGYRDTGRPGRCAYCLQPTTRACDSCGHIVCPDHEERHDAEMAHRSYTG